MGDGPGARHARRAPGRAAELIDRELGAFTAQHEPRELMAAAAGRRRPGRDGAALERPPARTRSSPTARSSAASSTRRWARCPYEGHQFRDPRLRQRAPLPGPVPRRAHLRGAHRGARARRRRGLPPPRQRRLRLSPRPPSLRRKEHDMDIKDRIAIVTGGGGGIGSAVARHWMAARRPSRGRCRSQRRDGARRRRGDRLPRRRARRHRRGRPRRARRAGRVGDRADRHLLLQRRRRRRGWPASRRRTRRGSCSGSCT